MRALSRDIALDDFDVFDEARRRAHFDSIIEDIHHYRLRIVYVKHLFKVINNELGHLGPLSVLYVGGWARDSRGNRGPNGRDFRLGCMSA